MKTGWGFMPGEKYRYDGMERPDRHFLELLKDGEPTEKYTQCPPPPYMPGDRLWVRETWAAYHHIAGGKVLYDADGKDYLDSDHLTVPHEFIKWRPSIHMPRAASRITLEVTDVRVEWLQDISVADALAEGVLPAKEWRHPSDGAIPAFADLWEKTYGPGAWEANPWVWVFCFKVLEVKG